MQKVTCSQGSIWDKDQLETHSGVFGIADQFLIENALMNEVNKKEINLAATFYDYQKAHDENDA